MSTSDSSEIDGVCDDNVDDVADADSLADGSDPGCTSFSDTSEVNGACDDLADNDADGQTDYPADPGCTSFSDTSELGTVHCDDGVDNSDADTVKDYPADAGCVSLTDTSEVDGQCDDTFDNDIDGTIDFTTVNGTADPECGSYADVEHECSDTDGGVVYTVQGTTSGSFGGTPFSGTDTCVNNTTLTEYYCNPFNLGSQSVNCALNATTQCSNGACV